MKLTWWRIAPEQHETRFRDWYGLCLSSPSPTETKLIDVWLAEHLAPDAHIRARTSMGEQFDVRIGSYKLPSFSVWFKEREPGIDFICFLRQFEPRPYEIKLSDTEVLDPNVLAHLKKVTAKWVVRAENGRAISMTRSRDADAVMVLLRLLGDPSL